MRPKGMHLTNTERQIIERMYNNGSSKKEIAKTIGCHLDTVYRELRLGYYEHLERGYIPKIKYSSDKAQWIHDYNATAKGAPLKIGNNHELARRIEDKIICDKYSPAAALAEIRNETGVMPFCVVTLYSYIDKGVFSKLTNKHLSEKLIRKRPYRKVRPAKRPPKGRSIEHRPKEINTRESFGHWEMDTVHGKAKGKGQSMLVLTERKTRYELMFKLKSTTSDEVVRALDKLERCCNFSSIFQTITVDNGPEFMNEIGMEYGKEGEERTTVYYCHPYCSSERGSNERNNRIIRRFFPKGQSLQKCTNKDLRKAQDWINKYPRRILGYQSAEILFMQELAKKNILWNFRNTT